MSRITRQKKVELFLGNINRVSDSAQFLHNWRHIARKHQAEPKQIDWLIWLLLGGRGASKTRTGAEWVRAQVADHGKRRIALIAPTFQDAHEVMIEGESGLQNIGYPSERPAYLSSRHRLEWPNEAVGLIFSSEDPDGLRGPQFDCAWADEFCAWSYPSYALSNLRLALRLGESPQMVITTTPKPIPALKQLMNNLARWFLSAMEDAYGGTRLGRQELNGEFLEDVSGALWSRKQLEDCVTASIPKLGKIIIAIDPPVSTGVRADSCGIILAGRASEGRAAKAYILS